MMAHIVRLMLLGAIGFAAGLAMASLYNHIKPVEVSSLDMMAFAATYAAGTVIYLVMNDVMVMPLVKRLSRRK